MQTFRTPFYHSFMTPTFVVSEYCAGIYIKSINTDFNYEYVINILSRVQKFPA